ncbi:MAG: hypothetical protein MHM6MM_009222, partial [Cercozoa sp. M6MM]
MVHAVVDVALATRTFWRTALPCAADLRVAATVCAIYTHLLLPPLLFSAGGYESLLTLRYRMYLGGDSLPPLLSSFVDLLRRLTSAFGPSDVCNDTPALRAVAIADAMHLSMPLVQKWANSSPNETSSDSIRWRNLVLSMRQLYNEWQCNNRVGGGCGSADKIEQFSLWLRRSTQRQDHDVRPRKRKKCERAGGGVVADESPEDAKNRRVAQLSHCISAVGADVIRPHEDPDLAHAKYVPLQFLWQMVFAIDDAVDVSHRAAEGVELVKEAHAISTTCQQDFIDRVS